MLATMLSNIPDAIRPPLLWRGSGEALLRPKEAHAARPPLLWRGQGEALRCRGRLLSQLIHHTYRCKNGVEGLLNGLETAVMNAGQAPIQVEIAT